MMSRLPVIQSFRCIPMDGAVFLATRCWGGPDTTWSKIWRLAGADHLHVNGLQNKFSESDDSVIASARFLPDADARPQELRGSCPECRAAARNLPPARLGRLMDTVGGGIMAHPTAAAGVQSLRNEAFGGRLRSGYSGACPRVGALPIVTAVEKLPDGPLVAWYGDDFTGSAAAAWRRSLSRASLGSLSGHSERDPAGAVPVTRYRHRQYRKVKRAGLDGGAFRRTLAGGRGVPITHYKVC